LHFRAGKTFGYLLIISGISFLVVGVVMPYYKVPQRMEGSGPNVEFAPDRPYAIRSYIIPPIDEGQPLNLSVISDKPGSTAVLLAGYDQQAQVILGPPLINTVFGQDQKGIAIFTKTTKSASIMLMITSYNSSYTFTLASVWSPFYDLRSFTTYGLFALPLGLVLVYYDGIVEARERMFERALANIPGRHESSKHS
jgi:hypothetical protein